MPVRLKIETLSDDGKIMLRSTGRQTLPHNDSGEPLDLRQQDGHVGREGEAVAIAALDLNGHAVLPLVLATFSPVVCLVLSLGWRSGIRKRGGYILDREPLHSYGIAQKPADHTRGRANGDSGIISPYHRGAPRMLRS